MSDTHDVTKEEKLEEQAALPTRFLSQGSPSVAILSLAKNTLGAGILALPQKTMYSGIPVFLLLLAMAGYFTVKSIQMIGKGARVTGKNVFEEITESLLGRKMAIVLGISMLLNCYGASIVFVMAIKDALTTLLDQTQIDSGTDWPLYATLIVGGTVLIPLSIFEKINSLRVLSLAGVLGVFFTVASVVYAYADLGVSPTLSAPPQTSVTASVMKPGRGFIEIMTAVSTLTFAFCNQFNVPQIYGELADKREATVSKVAYISTLLPMILYIIAAITGYMCYGFDIAGNILTNFAPLITEGNVLIITGVVAVALSVSMCHLLNNFPMRLSVLFFLPAEYQNNQWIKYAVPLLTATSSIAVAIAYSDLSMFLGLVGASTGSVICYIVPALFSIRVGWLESAGGQAPPELTDSASAKPRNVAMYTLKNHPVEVIMIIVGCIIGVVGTFSEFWAYFNPN